MNIRPGLGRACTLLMLLGSPAAIAQSVDERNWYEVELVVFSHETLASQVTERPLADPSRLGWLPRLRRLQAFSASLVYPFETELPAAGTSDAAVPPGLTQVLPQLPPEPLFGPLPAPATTRGFRLQDAARDPWIALDARSALFTQDLQRLESAVEHRVLWHATWRQPALPAGQTASILVQGGNRYGDRHELEGSVRLVDTGGRMQLDTHLWFSSFLAGFASEGTAWTLPALPAAVREAQDALAAEDPAGLGSWISSGAWQLRDNRPLSLDAFHYLDNPAIGVLVQLRSYNVPPRAVQSSDEDF